MSRRPNESPSRNTALTVLSVVVLLNACATAYGFAQLDRIAHFLRWELLPAAVQKQRGLDEATPARELKIEFWSDYTCIHCVHSAHVLLSLREQLREEGIGWQFRYLPRDVKDGSLGLQLALLAFCSEEPWLLLASVAAEDDLEGQGTRGFLDRLGPLPGDVESCVTSSAATDRIWQDRLEAARRGILVTPTLVVDGVKLEGELVLDPVVALIQDRLRLREGQ